jgi:hypothetical protein
MLSDDQLTVSWKEYESKLSWLNLIQYPGMRLEELKNNTENLNQDSRSPGQYLNPGPPEYEGVLTTGSQRSIWYSFKQAYRQLLKF